LELVTVLEMSLETVLLIIMRGGDVFCRGSTTSVICGRESCGKNNISYYCAM